MRHSLALFLLLTLTACSIFDTPSDDAASYKQVSVEEMYRQAKEYLNEENYESAVKSYEALQSRYPYGRYAQQAQLETAYAYYRQSEPALAISTAERFIKQYPNNPHVDYAYYLKGLANFAGEIGILRSFGGQDPTERDPKAARDSFAAFKDLVTRFPDSKYSPDSRLRMQYLVNALAKYELHVAGYYLRRGAHIAAINRAQSVLTQYPNSPSTRDALKILVQAYDAMGMRDLRDDARRVLEINSGAPASSGGDEAADSGKPWWQFWR
ncbi:MAG: outer membrane protein assembly factor BamD [Gallionellales bacterium RIFCSPLOWO2_12_FULL_59_22]|nr:MAG: outer membrane protein assembly factor BamD [Gallionellales bacterium RIFCSPLOWO2_02_FULL_59_110]OGT01504.1 MAG: outer membrane protein assembly factor BamD [Gallionellales bacterium RIFCSPLOWO2_02_58_13]OGT14525.1 MAG: outer membrane protein assembly factor BamD [Gallionellales bacterium RIFCSPLOWO2_12_FULL_59_22]